MRECHGSWARIVGRRLALLLVILACALPVSAGALPGVRAAASDSLFDSSLLVFANEIKSFRTDTLLIAAANEDWFVFGATPAAANRLAEPNGDQLNGNQLNGNQSNGNQSNGAYGVRRFIFVALLFGAILRFLTSSTFYGWASEVFGPLHEY